MKHFIKFTALLTAVILLLGTVGCKDSYQNAIIYYEVPERPFTLDAQTASTDSELSIVKNIYEGLLRKNSSGAVVCGAAESFEKTDSNIPSSSVKTAFGAIKSLLPPPISFSVSAAR